MRVSLQGLALPGGLVRPVNTVSSNQRLQINLLRIVCAFASLLICVQSVSANDTNEVARTETTATIDFVKGYATVFPNQISELAKFAQRDMRVSEGDLLITGQEGFISISFHSDSVAHIQPSSHVILEKIDCGANSDTCSVVMNVLSGSITSNVVNQSTKDAHFSIKTPYASAAVRGTVFDVDVSNGKLLAGVTEGLVNISAPSATVDVPENFGISVVDDQPLTALKPLPPQPTFIPGAVRFEDGGELAWENIASAAQYIVSLQAESGLAYQAVVRESLHQMEALNAGTYTAQVRAVDADGFKGPVATKSLNIIKTVHTVAGPLIKSQLFSNRFEVSIDEKTSPTKLFELHFSPTQDFERLTNLDVNQQDVISGVRVANTIYVRARGILSNSEVTPFGPIVEISGKL